MALLVIVYSTISDKAEEEPADGNPRCRKKAKKNHRELKYTGTTGGVKRSYLECNWNNEGLRRFKTLSNMMKTFLKDDEIWPTCIAKWNEYLQEKKASSVGKIWVPAASFTSGNDGLNCDENDIEGGDEHEGVLFHFEIEDDVNGDVNFG